VRIESSKRIVARRRVRDSLWMRWLLLLLLAGCGPLSSPPTTPSVAIEPASPTVDDSLTCVLTAQSTDPDGQMVDYRFDWAVDGEWLGLEDAVLPAAQTRSGEEWSCRAIAFDESLESEPSEPAVVTIP
jgi:hypothetical protein